MVRRIANAVLAQRRALHAAILATAVAIAPACSSTSGDAGAGAADAAADAQIDATSPGDAGAPDAGGSDADASLACTGIQCQAQMDDCAGAGMPNTTISGTVYDPAGVLPLYNVYVYIPNAMPAPIAVSGPTCTQCQAPASGSPVIGALTDANGNFTLEQHPGDMWGVPSGSNVPLVLQVGKWRRQVTIPGVQKCAPNLLPVPTLAIDRLRLPAKASEGDLPRIAVLTGADPAECFLRSVGIDDSEFSAPGSFGHVAVFTGEDEDSQNAVPSASQITGGDTPQDTYSWWSSLSNLQQFDALVLSDEALANSRGAAATQAMHDYVSGGGRLFAVGYQYNWFAPPDGPTDFQGVASWPNPEGDVSPYTGFFVDSTFPRGKGFADWLQAQNLTVPYGQLNLAMDTFSFVGQVNAPTSRWIYNANGASTTPYATTVMTFNAPVGSPPASQCGRALFTDAHVAGTSDDSTFPNECVTADPDGSHRTNAKALEFMFFDLFACVQDDSQPPVTPTSQ